MRRIAVFTVLSVLSLAAGACFGGSDDSEATPTATAEGTAAATETATATPTAELTGTPSPDRYGRAGVRLADNTEVEVELVGSGACDDWSFVDSPSGKTWVREEYLAEAPDATVAVPSSGSNPGGTATPPSGTPTPAPTTAPPATPPPPPPPLTFTPTGLNFGVWDLGTGLSKTVAVRNTSTSPVAITGVEFSNGGLKVGNFSMGANTCSHQQILQPGEVCGVGVTFVPTSTGLQSAILYVFYNQQWSTPVSVPVVGTGR